MSKLETTEVKEVAKTPANRDDFMYVEIPAADLFDQPHPGVRLNRVKFEAGKRYSVRADVAIEVEDRLRRFNAEQVRLLRPNADRRALTDVNRGSQWTNRGGGNAISLDAGLGSVGGADDKVFTVDF